LQLKPAKETLERAASSYLAKYQASLIQWVVSPMAPHGGLGWERSAAQQLELLAARLFPSQAVVRPFYSLSQSVIKGTQWRRSRLLARRAT